MTNDKPPREFWIHVTGNAYTRDVSSNFPVTHVIEYSAYERQAATIEKLRSAIEDLPHDFRCMVNERPSNPAMCDCPKNILEALEELERG